MANTDYGAIPLTLATAVSQKLNQKLGVTTGFKPSEWADAINLLGRLPNKTVSGSICHFTDGVSLPLVNGKFGITAYQDGTGTPSPSNVRAIHGYTGMNVIRTGKNLYHYDSSKVEKVTTNQSTQRAILHTGIYGNDLTFTASLIDEQEVTTQNIFVAGYKDGIATIKIGFITASTIYERTVSFDDDEEAVLLASTESLTGITSNLPKYNIQLELGSSATAYSAYNGTTYPLTWQNECFGGYIDYKRGKKVTTYWKIDLGSGTWTYHQASGNFTDYFDYTMPSGHNANVINGSTLLKGACECYNIVNSGSIAISETDAVISIAVNKRRIIICDTRYTDGDDLQEYLDGKVLVYELETPIEEDIILPIIFVLEGENNIWNTCGDSQVRYMASSASTAIGFTSECTGSWSSTDDERTFLTVTASDKTTVNFGTGMTGYTNCGSNDGYFAVYKNSTQVFKKAITTGSTLALGSIPSVNLDEGDVLTFRFGFANNHSNIKYNLYNGIVDVGGVASVTGIVNVTNTSTKIIGITT